MKKLRILAVIFTLFAAASEVLCSPVLISVELQSMENKKAWHQLRIPTYELIGNTAIAEAEESLLGSLKQKGYQVNIMDPQPEPEKYVILSKKDKTQIARGTPVWQNDRAAIIKQASKDIDMSREYKHNIRPMNSKPLGDRFWKSVTTKYVSLKSIPYDPFIQSLVDQVNADSITANIQRLQDFRTRFFLTDSSYAVSQWLLEKLTGWGYTAEYDSFYFYIILDSIQSVQGYERNVIASKYGLVYPECISIISGHFDAVSPDPFNVAPGADDNASGTAGAMEISRVLSSYSWNRSIRFCGWAAEEAGGGAGSHHYANYADSINMDIVNMFNMDMIGYKTNTIIDGKLSSPQGWLLNLAAQVLPQYSADYQYWYTGQTGCDDQYFAENGYATMAYEEPGLNPNHHCLTDSLNTLTPELYTKNTKAALALMAVILLHPKTVEPFVWDVGNGNSLLVTWEPNIESEVEGYYIYWGKNSGTYSDSAYISGKETSSDTVNGLLSDTTYYFIVRAVASGGKYSLDAIEKSEVPRSTPLLPVGKAFPIANGISYAWTKNAELDIDGYRIYRSIDSNISYDSLNTSLVTDTSYIDQPLSGEHKYYYKVRSFDKEGKFSPLSDSVYCRPITLDQGILLVDETNNWTSGSFPRDAQQDSFYNYILSGYKYEQYEYGTSLQKPILADFGPYSTVTWLADDYTTMLASGATEDIKSYLDNGGKIWFAGWKPSSDIGSALYDQFKVSYTGLSGATDSFKTALGLKGYPDITIDTMKYPSTIWGNTYRYIESLAPLAGADTIYVMDMRNNSSLYEGRACAVRDSGRTVFFGFPLYFMDKEQAKLAAQKVMEEFGEEPLGVTGKPENLERIKDVRLFQNSPNPFSSRTNISYQLPKAGPVKLNIYNITGQLVRTLVNGNQAAGSYEIKWDRLDSKNRKVSAGVYIYHLSTYGKTQSRKMVVLK